MSMGLQGICASFQPLNIARFDEEHDDRWVTAYQYNYQRRDARSILHYEELFTGLWPSSRMGMGDPTSPLTVLGADSSSVAWPASFEETDLGLSGSSRQYFFTGSTTNAAGALLAGVQVSSFVTSGNVLAGNVTSDVNGNYQCPTPYIGQAHYLLAFYPGSPDLTGMSDTNLIPAL